MSPPSLLYSNQGCSWGEAILRTWEAPTGRKEVKKHLGGFSESYFTLFVPSLLNWNRATFSADNRLLKDGPGICSPHQPSGDFTVNVPHDKRKTKQVAEEQDVGNRERAEGCSSGRG